MESNQIEKEKLLEYAKAFGIPIEEDQPKKKKSKSKKLDKK